MTQFLTTYISRLLIGGFFVFAAMAIAGKGNVSEPLRIVCACFMIILILTPNSAVPISIENIAKEIRGIEQDLEESIKNYDEITFDGINESVEEYIQNTIDIDDMEIDVRYRIGEDGEYIIDEIIVYSSELQDIEIKDRISEITGVPNQNIILGE